MRRFAVPRGMIEAATVRRLAGDWRGACAVANVEVDVDLSAIGRDHARAVAESVEDDLRHLAPDLLRWHVDRLVPARPRRAGSRPCSAPIQAGTYRSHVATAARDRVWYCVSPARPIRFADCTSTANVGTPVVPVTCWPATVVGCRS
ncbi:hypothetical protein [Dactylosporangium sp. AC04546]|uniref:hypothetical protein n=1 Tax=Dactylosporangium sp. AC04546 TaxID=2862460 RepID=UPI003FA4B119